MKYVGVDLHKKSISLCVVSEVREVLQSRRFHCDEPQRIEAFFHLLGPHQVVVEATVGYEWFLRLVDLYADRAVLAHPGKLRVIAESTRKSDKLDAKVLAEFLALGMIPEAHRPTPRVRDHRSLVRHRQFMQQRITATKSMLCVLVVVAAFAQARQRGLTELCWIKEEASPTPVIQLLHTLLRNDNRQTQATMRDDPETWHGGAAHSPDRRPGEWRRPLNNASWRRPLWATPE